MNTLFRERNTLALFSAMLVAAIGKGVYLSTSVIFLLTVVGLSPAQVGVGTSAAAVAGLLCSFPVGVIADRIGQKPTMFVLMLIESVSMASFALTTSFWHFVISICCFSAAFTASFPVTQSIVAVITTEKVKAMAVILALRNLGIGLGSIIAIPFLNSGDAHLGRLILGLVAACMAVSLIGIALIKAPRQVHAQPLSSAFVALRDVRFATLALLVNVPTFVIHIMLIGMPLWITTTDILPHSFVSWGLVINTAVIVLAQVPITSLVTNLRRAQWALYGAGLGLLVCCGLLGAGLLSDAYRSLVIICFVVVTVLAVTECAQTSASWTISYAFAPAEQRTTYLALFNMSFSVVEIIAPLVITTWVMDAGATGWWVLGIILLIITVIAGVFSGRRQQPQPGLA